jgi:cation:H+ antiporter
MHPLLQHAGLLAAGIALLLVGGRLLVSASVDTARRLGVPPLLVGLTLVAWGTSAPELALNVVSSLKGRSDLAVGNVVGANICNMALVLGTCALLRPLRVGDQLIRVELWLNAAMLGLLGVFGLAGTGYERWEAGLLLGAFGAYSAWTITSGLRERQQEHAALVPEQEPEGYPLPPMSWWRIGTLFAGGLGLLSFGGSLASDAAVGLAEAAGVPRSVVAVTVVSLGTTLPETVTGVLAVRRGQVDLAMGNAIGSCLFNAGAIFGIAGLISPPGAAAAPASADLSLAVMMALAVLLLPIARTHSRHVSRAEGAVLLAAYAGFLAGQGWLALRAE